jgi:hypothetical protein
MVIDNDQSELLLIKNKKQRPDRDFRSSRL